MWSDLDAIAELLLAVLGAITLTVMLLTYIEDHLDPDPYQPRGAVGWLRALRARWRSTTDPKDSEDQ